MTEMTDEEVFGGQPAQRQRPVEMSDADVFGPQAPTMTEYAVESGKAAIRGGIANTAVGLQGFGAAAARTPLGSQETAMRMAGLPEGLAQEESVRAMERIPQPEGPRPVDQEPLYKAGQAMSDWLDTGPLKSRHVLNPLFEDVMAGTGSVGANILTALVSPAGALMSLPAMGAGEAAERAVKAGVTPEQQSQAGAFGSIAGATDLIDIALPFLGTAGKVLGLIKRVGLRALEGALIEGGQEGLQQFIQNVIAKGIYKPDQDLTEDVSYNALVGGIVGGKVAALTGGHSVHPPAPATEADVTSSGIVPPTTPPPGRPPGGPPSAPTTPPAAPPTVQPPGEMVGGEEGIRDAIGSLTPQQLADLEVKMVTAYGRPAQETIRDATGFDMSLPDFLGSMGITKPEQLTDANMRKLGMPEVHPSSVLQAVANADDTFPPGWDSVDTGVKPLEPEQGQSKRYFLDPVSLEAQDMQLAPKVNVPLYGPSNRELILKRGRGSVWMVPAYATMPLHDALDRLDFSYLGERTIPRIIAEAMRAKIKQVVPSEMVPVNVISNADMNIVLDKLDMSTRGGRTNGLALNLYEGPHKGRGPIYINRAIMNDPNQTSHVVLHEAVHSATVHLISTDMHYNSILEDMLQEVKNSVPQNEHRLIYGLTNVMEFIAEAFSNPAFQQRLQELRINGEFMKSIGLSVKKPSAWQAFVHWVRAKLGLQNEPQTYSMLEATIRIGSRIIDTQARLLGDPQRIETHGLTTNQHALDRVAKDVPAAPIQPETEGIRTRLNTAFAGHGGVPPAVAASAAHADKMNRFYKWMAGLSHLVRANPTFGPLLRYTERIRQMHNEEAQIQDFALRIGKRWRSLGHQQSEALVAFLDDLTNMNYRTPKEVANGVARHPTVAEAQALARKHGLSADAIKIAGEIKTGFSNFLELNRRNAVREAIRTITDPVKLAAKIDQINTSVDALKSKPYFPFMRFGRHFVMVRDASGHTLHFETFEGTGLNPLQTAVRKQQRRFNELSRLATAGEKVTFGELPEVAAPFLGLPPHLIEAIQANLTLTPQQRDALEQIALDFSPAMSFKHRFQHKSYTPGYSMDFRRAFARYFFHGARYYSRTKYMPALNEHIKEARRVENSNKANEIGNYMEDHLHNTVLDAKGDFGIFKGAIFLWALGYVPAAALMNMTQTPVITYNFLAGKFGEPRAIKHLVWAMGQVSNFYRRGKYDTMPHWEMQALGYGIKTGRISETQAAQLAGMAQGNNLLLGLGGDAVQRGAIRFMEGAAVMFEMAEQFNRRVAYRAALRLAMEKPNAKVVQEAITENQLEYDALLATKQFSPAQTRAIIAANSIVEQTQYVYARHGRARFMRGRTAGTVLVFKQYLINTLWMLGQNKKDVLPRYLLMALALGGVSGLPGYDDLREILKAIMAWRFGKQYNMDHEIRKYVKEWAGDGGIDGDLVLHGLAQRGFGVPAVLDLLGSFATGIPGRGLDPAKSGQNVPFPVFDRSRAVSLGPLLPLEVGKLFYPTKDVNSTIAEQTQRASGAFWSVGFNMYKAVMDQDHALNDWKRWERAVPRALGNASKAFRAYTEERERGSKGGPNSAATVIPYDPRDTEQMMEILGIAAGYTPLRQQTKWDNSMAKMELEKFYELQKSGLLQQLFEARKGGDEKEIEAVMDSIREFNGKLPDEGRGYRISADTVRSSMKTRERELQHREAGQPVQKAKRPISQYIDELFPAGAVDVRRVR